MCLEEVCKLTRIVRGSELGACRSALLVLQSDRLRQWRRAEDRERRAGGDRRAVRIIGDRATEAPDRTGDRRIEADLILRRAGAPRQDRFVTVRIGKDDPDIGRSDTNVAERELRRGAVAERDRLVTGGVDGR